MKKLKLGVDDGEISQAEADWFFDGVQAFYVATTAYAIKNLPLKDEVVINSSWVNYSQHLTCNFNQINFFVNRLVLYTMIWFYTNLATHQQFKIIL